MKHHFLLIRILTMIPLKRGVGQCLAGQFDWGGFLPKSNGGSTKVPSAWLATMRRAYA